MKHEESVDLDASFNYAVTIFFSISINELKSINGVLSKILDNYIVIGIYCNQSVGRNDEKDLVSEKG